MLFCDGCVRPLIAKEVASPSDRNGMKCPNCGWTLDIPEGYDINEDEESFIWRAKGHEGRIERHNVVCDSTIASPGTGQEGTCCLEGIVKFLLQETPAHGTDNSDCDCFGFGGSQRSGYTDNDTVKEVVSCNRHFTVVCATYMASGGGSRTWLTANSSL